MLTAGDELGRTQKGNNNAYCQDNEITFIDWPNADHALAEFVGGLSSLRARFAVLRQDGSSPGNRQRAATGPMFDGFTPPAGPCGTRNGPAPMSSRWRCPRLLATTARANASASSSTARPRPSPVSFQASERAWACVLDSAAAFVGAWGKYACGEFMSAARSVTAPTSDWSERTEISSSPASRDRGDWRMSSRRDDEALPSLERRCSGLPLQQIQPRRARERDRPRLRGARVEAGPASHAACRHVAKIRLEAVRRRLPEALSRRCRSLNAPGPAQPTRRKSADQDAFSGGRVFETRGLRREGRVAPDPRGGRFAGRFCLCRRNRLRREAAGFGDKCFLATLAGDPPCRFFPMLVVTPLGAPFLDPEM